MGVSPVLASIIMITVTIAGGMAIWSYVNTTSSQVTEAYGQDVTSEINKLNEEFIITYLGLNSTTDTVIIWMYNNGHLDTEIKQIIIWTLTNTTATSTVTNLQLAKGGVGNVTFAHSIVSNETYYISAVALHGTTQTTFKRAN